MNITLSETSRGDDFSETIRCFKNAYPLSMWKRYGLFDENFIETIDIHWMKFQPPHNTNHYVLAALYILIMTTGWSGNAFVILMFLRCKSLRTPANTLVMNLATSDLLMMSKMPIFIFNSICLGPALGKIGCHIYGFVGGISGTVSICTLALISLDRYYVIKFPLNMRFTQLRAKICIAISWCYGAIFAGLPLLRLEFGSYVPEGYLTSCSFDYLSPNTEVKIFIFIFFVAAWIVPFVLIMFCYANILKTVLKTRNLSRRDSESSRHMKMEEKRRQEFKLALTILLIIGVWFAAWSPYSVVALLGISNRADLIPPLASMIPALFCKTAACVDPFIYAITNQKFKNEVRKLFISKSTSEPKNSSGIWTTKNVLEKRIVMQNMHSSHSCQASEEVEEIMVPVENIKNVQDRRSFLPSSEEQQVVKRESVETSTSDMEMSKSNFRPSWWYRPTFNNKSSFRNVARSLKGLQKQKSVDCDYCSEQLDSKM